MDSTLRETGLVPLVSEVARAVQFRPPETLYKTPRFRRHYRARLHEYPRKPRRTYSRAHENKAIAFLNEMVERTGRVPPKTEIARAAGVERKCLNRYPRLRALYDAALASAKRKQKGGKAFLVSLEDQAILLLGELADSTGRVPSIRQIARALLERHLAAWRQQKRQRPGVPHHILPLPA